MIDPVRLEIATRHFNVGSFLRSKNIPYHETGSDYMIDCPFCGDTRSRFGISTRTKVNHCFNCGYRGTLVGFLEDLLGVSETKAAELIVANKARSTEINFAKKMVADAVAIDYPPVFRPLSYPETEENSRYWKYLTGVPVKGKSYMAPPRGLLSSTVLEYKIGYCPRGQYKFRVVVPVFWFGTLVTWVARDVTGRKQKILTPENNSQKDYLLNLDKLWGNEEVVLVEGPFDMLKVPDLAVTSFGKSLSAKQMSLLKHAGVKRVIIGYDDDARPDTWETAQKLNEWFDVRIMDMPHGEDPGSLPEARTRQLVREAQSYSSKGHILRKAGIVKW